MCRTVPSIPTMNPDVMDTLVMESPPTTPPCKRAQFQDLMEENQGSALENISNLVPPEFVNDVKDAEVESSGCEPDGDATRFFEPHVEAHGQMKTALEAVADEHSPVEDRQFFRDIHTNNKIHNLYIYMYRYTCMYICVIR